MKADAQVRTPADYIASAPPDRREALARLDAAIRKAAPGLAPHLAHGMLAYGSFLYKYAGGREGDWAVVALASQKRHLSLYLCVPDGEGYLAERHAGQLGKVSVGKSCIRFKRLEDLNLDLALKLVRESARLAKEQAAKP